VGIAVEKETREQGMGRVRIYELAKEVGMSSKALAAKLSEQGYDVKGPSSTVDEQTAVKIRASVLKSAESESAEKRTGATQGPTVIRRRPTIIRRRPQEEPEQPEKVEQERERAAEVLEPVDIPTQEKVATVIDAASDQDVEAEMKSGPPPTSDELTEAIGNEKREGGAPAAQDVYFEEPPVGKPQPSEKTERFRPEPRKEAPIVKKGKKEILSLIHI
jgi:translation initiation factor IF-2